jgi:hypothetical protein
MSSTKQSTQVRDENMASAGYVPTRVCLALGGGTLSSLTKAIGKGRLTASRYGQKLWFVEWASYVRMVGAVVGPQLPANALEALRKANAHRAAQREESGA